MKLNRVEIRNFRSIEDETITFDPTCRVLVGINESGKSNILEALALLDEDREPIKKNDLREALPDEELIDEAYIRFVFKFEKDESGHLLEEVTKKIIATSDNPKMVSCDGRQLTLKSFCSSRNEGLFSVDILDETKRCTHWAIPKKYKLFAGWKKPTSACPADYTIECGGEDYKLAQFKLISTADVGDVPEDYLEDASIGDLTSLVGKTINSITEESLPDVLFWEYDENNLLPSSINIAEFCTDPKKCLPLQNMFTLAGIEDIKDSIEDAQTGTENQFQNYLNGVAKKTTNHFRKVWKEYKDIEFSLRLNADQIIPGVKEKNIYDFARRSDGFKRFVTFLLMISVNVKTDNLRDTLLLIDEPDTSLHPSGARYLRDELINIAKKNYVVYSTHSIFMIDSGDIGRHYIVKKKGEITSIEEAHASNIADEEVLYNALGHSVFAVLKVKNIIFEGWTDKHLFQVALGNASATLKRKYKDVGMCHGKGVKTIKAITPLIELANRKCLIVSDSDKPAKDHKKLYVKDKGYGEWQTYQDIDQAIEAITAEDFLKNDYIARKVNSALSGKSIPTFSTSELPDKKGKLAAIKKWLIDNGMTEDQANETLPNIKCILYENLKSQNIDDVYSKILSGISL
ncbi:ATP-binding protein [Patescibacteria group bacterium]|nr:ATP-binding protein [Patescibacteria group bacterium]